MVAGPRGSALKGASPPLEVGRGSMRPRRRSGAAKDAAAAMNRGGDLRIAPEADETAAVHRRRKGRARPHQHLTPAVHRRGYGGRLDCPRIDMAAAVDRRCQMSLGT